ncbi:GNAT family N-acetyltransferase [Algoriphagus halophytocola]|uniref:GNAT family N-acetyltransferase n=1 Tax=Algoriphagus halophytocola TaxID=2991499 RepID=A0ABY6MNQ2_9BACT|nr:MULTISPECIES: GNAT family N-acetyltransferase [unclassified Algoriphagus]UZD23951.1 GNAT family N-acetyltransferase [Algoriphagus sp. TR-M5]WBL41322.1 GNAT family N-acetyltransferase [Algoriphagus sp. TR-M9]
MHKNSSLIYLPFDSQLFGYSVAKCTIDHDWDERKFMELAREFQLVYIFSSDLLEIQHPSIRWIENKVTYSKELISTQDVSTIFEYRGGMNKQLQALALQSGVYSRFKVDARLYSDEFQNLYMNWIDKALKNDMVLTNHEYTALLTLSRGKMEASIGLLAVEESARGRGLGKILIKAAESRAYSFGAKRLRVTTQKQNEVACHLYSSLGYELTDQMNIYHFWKS